MDVNQTVTEQGERDRWGSKAAFISKFEDILFEYFVCFAFF